MFDTYTNPSGRIVLKDKEFSKEIEERIASGNGVYAKAPRQDGFSFKVNFRGDQYSVEGTYTWNEEGFDTITITKS